MSSSASAVLGWGVDLGCAEDGYITGALAPIAERIDPDSLYVWEYETLPPLYGTSPLPVKVVDYGYEYDSTAVVLARSRVRTCDYSSAIVDPARVAPPTDEELGHLRVAIESLGLTFDPAEVVLLLMVTYG